MTGGYPNGRVFWGSNLAMGTWEKKGDINPIVWNVRFSEDIRRMQASARVNQATLKLDPLGDEQDSRWY